MGERGIFQLPESVASRMKRISYGWIQPPSPEPRTDNVMLFAIHGPYSGGKTKLGIRISEACQQLAIPCFVLEEQFTENMHLIILDEMKRRLALNPYDEWARQQAYILSDASETVFLERKRKQVEEITTLLNALPSGIVGLEAAVHVDPIYAWAFWVQDLMREQDLNKYLQQYQPVQEAMPLPDIVFAITVSPEKLIARKKRRDVEERKERAFEKGIPPEELAVIAHISNNVADQLETKGWPVVTIDTDKCDYAYNPDGVRITHQLIQDQIRQIALRRGMSGFGNL